MGTRSLADINPSHVCTRNLSDHFVMQPGKHLFESAYQPMRLASTYAARAHL